MDPIVVVKYGKSKKDGNGIVFGSGSGEGLKQNRGVQKGKRHGNGKSIEVGRPKQTGTKPTRGLIFGPTKGEIELSASGKRLRIEQPNVGRSGGFVMTEELNGKRNGGVGQQRSESSMEGSGEQENGSSGSDLVMYGGSSEKPIEKNGA